MSENYIRQTFVYGNHFWNFYNSQNNEVQNKIDWVIGLVRTLQVVPVKFFKYLEGTDGIYEMRIKVGNNIFRVFCFFDKNNLVILLNGFKKKANKTPKQEIERANKLKQEYYEKNKKTK